MIIGLHIGIILSHCMSPNNPFLLILFSWTTQSFARLELKFIMRLSWNSFINITLVNDLQQTKNEEKMTFFRNLGPYVPSSLQKMKILFWKCT